MSLKLKAIKSFNWTILELFFSQGTTFIVGIILARILLPEDFGVIGIIGAFLAVSNSIVEGGFFSALLRKTDSDENDYNTAFYSNLIIGVFLYSMLILFSHKIGDFFEIQTLAEILNYSGIVLIINSFSIVQTALLSKQLNFKTLSLISIFSSIFSGLIAVILAYNNFGIWSLVVLLILKPLSKVVLLWLNNNWHPKFIFSKKSFLDLFDYGYKVLLAGLINTIYKNIYYIIIGKFFTPTALGFYTRAEQFQSPISGNITRAIGKISFPMLSEMQNDPEKLKKAFIKFLKFSIFINFPIMLGISALAEPIVLILVGQKWSTSILYLRLLCVPGMLYPLQILHLNLLLVKGHSNLNLRLEILKKIILIPMIAAAISYGIEALIYSIILFSFIEYFINSFYTNKLIGYSLKRQIKDIFPYAITSLLTFLAIYSFSFIQMDIILKLVAQILIGAIVFLSLNEFIRFNEYIEIRNIIKVYLKRNGN